MADWSGYANRLRVGKDWAVMKYPTQADPGWTLQINTYAQTDYTYYDYDVSMTISGSGPTGIITKRMHNSDWLQFHSFSWGFSALYDREQQGYLDLYASGQGAGPVSGRWYFNVPRRPTAAPNPPQNLKIASSTSTSLTASWTASSDMKGCAFGGYGVSIDGGAFVTTGSSGSATSHTFTGLEPGSTHTIKVRVTGNGWDATRQSSEPSINATTPVSAPTLTGVPAATSVKASSFIIPLAQVSNNGGQDPTDYRAQVNTSASETGATTIARGTWTPITVSGRAPSLTYYYRVSASNNAGWGPWTDWTTVTTLDGIPNDPGAPTVAGITDNTATISWTEPTTNGADITGYNIRVALFNDADSPPVKVGQSSSTFWGATGLTKGTDYYVFVQAISANGVSGWSPGTKFRTTGTLSTLFPYVKVSGVWKQVQAYQKVAGVWKRVYLNARYSGTWRSEQE